MPPVDLTTALRRHRVPALLGALLVLLAAFVVATRPGVYWTRVEVQMLSPTRNEADAAAMAGVIKTRLVGYSDAPGPNAAELNIVDEGIYEGMTVRVASAGGQWERAFAPTLIIQVSSRDRAVVDRRIADVLRHVQTVLDEQQAGVPAGARFAAWIAPGDPAVRYAAPHRGASFVITFGVGLALVVGAVSLLDARRSGPSGTPEEGGQHPLGHVRPPGTGRRLGRRPAS